MGNWHVGPKERVKSEELYLQFIFVKDLDEVYENELSEALKNETKKDNSISSQEHKDWAFTNITSMLNLLFNNNTAHLPGHRVDINLNAKRG